jgi:phosphoglycolate phosphatase-like HAD superfamily hydrolase
MDTLFRDLISGDDGFPKKPDPAGIEAIVKRNDLDKDVSMVIGDRAVDIEAGRLAGLRTCLLGPDDQGIEPTYRVADLGELVPVMHSEAIEGTITG